VRPQVGQLHPIENYRPVSPGKLLEKAGIERNDNLSLVPSTSNQFGGCGAGSIPDVELTPAHDVKAAHALGCRCSFFTVYSRPFDNVV